MGLLHAAYWILSSHYYESICRQATVLIAVFPVRLMTPTNEDAAANHVKLHPLNRCCRNHFPHIFQSEKKGIDRLN